MPPRPSGSKSTHEPLLSAGGEPPFATRGSNSCSTSRPAWRPVNRQRADANFRPKVTLVMVRCRQRAFNITVAGTHEPNSFSFTLRSLKNAAAVENIAARSASSCAARACFSARDAIE